MIPEITTPLEDPPLEDPPLEDPPLENPPLEDPPLEDPHLENPPLEITTPENQTQITTPENAVIIPFTHTRVSIQKRKLQDLYEGQTVSILFGRKYYTAKLGKSVPAGRRIHYVSGHDEVAPDQEIRTRIK